MKKLVVSIVSAFVLLGNAAVTQVFAETQTSDGWNVTLSKDGKSLSDNFNNPAGGNSIQDVLSNMQPGDTANFIIDVKNESPNSADFYLLNNVIDSFEQSVDASGGGYSYILSYEGKNSRDLYNSTNVGGDNSTGLMEVSEKGTGLEDYIFLDNISKGGSGKVKLQVTLDGESQPNVYQNSFADLSMKFAVEVIPVPTPKSREEKIERKQDRVIYLPNTGDDSNLGLYIGGFVVSLLLAAYAYYRLKKISKKA